MAHESANGAPVSPSAIPEAQPSSGWGCSKLLGIGCLSVTIILVVVILALPAVVSQVAAGIVGILNPGPPVASVVSTQTIVQGIQPMGQLVSISAQLAKADIFIGVQQGALNACGFGANHVAQGAIEAGINLTQVTAEDVTYNGVTDAYTLTLPPAQLTSCRVDFIRQYDRTTTTCAVDWDEARLLANYTSLIEFRDDALEGGILNRAEQEARLVLGNFVRLLTGRDVEIGFKPADGATMPPSCQPEVPQGWAFTQETGAWLKQQ
jgi:hypothetical protein